MKLKSKTAIITGAGAGMGRATSILFAREGANVAAVDIVEDRARETVDSILQDGGNALTIQADVSDEEDLKRIVDTTVKQFGGINILINNAAAFVHKNIFDSSREDWELAMGVNVIGPARLATLAVPIMEKQGGGSIVNISSIGGLVGGANAAPYNSSKAAVISLTRCMAADFAPQNVRVNAICPGAIHTPAFEHFIDRAGMSLEKAEEVFGGQQLVKRLGQPEDIADAVLFLVSDVSSFITGTHLVVDGGYTAA